MEYEVDEELMIIYGEYKGQIGKYRLRGSWGHNNQLLIIVDRHGEWILDEYVVSLTVWRRNKILNELLDEEDI